MTEPPVIGLDIGGANVKAAHSRGRACTRPFALWKDPAGLAGVLREVLARLPPAGALAVTMTGELCDCFATKRQGVRAILDATAGAAGGLPVHVWTTAGRFVSLAAALADPLPAAAANWLALAAFAGRFAPAGWAVLLDCGTTTTDVIPLHDGRPVPRGRTDAERLHTRELVYSGVRRTPVCALDPEVMAELFATTQDVYLVLGKLPEDPEDCGTADGKPATRAHAHYRLARLLGGDGELTPPAGTLALAARVARTQRERIGVALEAVTGRCPGRVETVLLSGAGEFLAREAWEQWRPGEQGNVVSLGQRLGPEVSEAACALAVARLLAEQGSQE